MTALETDADGPFTPVARLTRDIKAAAATLSDAEARFLVDSYYTMQNARIRAGNQIDALRRNEEPNSVLSWLSEQDRVLEAQVRRALDAYSAAHPVGAWLRGVKGIGPVLAAGLLAHIDIERAPTAGHIWRFAGLDPTSVWAKGGKRPWNARLKVVCWKLGESFVKVSGDPEAFYGQAYATRKARESAKNAAGDFAAQAAARLAAARIGKATEAYKHYAAGRLPPAHVHARAKRWAVKLFLAHLHEQLYRQRYGKPPPLPYPIAHLGHAHRIEPPS